MVKEKQVSAEENAALERYKTTVKNIVTISKLEECLNTAKQHVSDAPEGANKKFAQTVLKDAESRFNAISKMTPDTLTYKMSATTYLETIVAAETAVVPPDQENSADALLKIAKGQVATIKKGWPANTTNSMINARIEDSNAALGGIGGSYEELRMQKATPEIPAVPQVEQKSAEEKAAEGTADLRQDLKNAQSSDDLKRIEDVLRKRWQDAMSDFQKVSGGWFTSEAAKAVGAQILKDMEGEYKAFLVVRKQAAKTQTLEFQKYELEQKIKDFEVRYTNMDLTTDLNQRIQTLLKTEGGRSVLQKVLPSDLAANVLYVDPRTREADPQKQMQAYTTIKEMSAEGKQEIIDLLLSTKPTATQTIARVPSGLKSEKGAKRAQEPKNAEVTVPSAEVTLSTQVTGDHVTRVRNALKKTEFFSANPDEWLAPLKKYGREETRSGVIKPVLVIDANSLLKAPEFEGLRKDVSSLNMEKELKGATFEFQILMRSITVKLVKKKK